MSSRNLQALHRACYLLILPIVQIGYFILNSLGVDPYPINTFIDDYIPFNKFFVIPYAYWYIYMYGSLLFLAVFNYKLYFKLLTAIVSGVLICYVIYFFFPTTMPRPEVVGDDVFSSLVRFIYASDRPLNCFPSIHALDAFLISAFLYHYNKNLVFRAFVIISGVSISLSTMLVKQHGVFDVISATVLGIILYMVINGSYIYNWEYLRRIMNYLVPERLKTYYLEDYDERTT